MPELIVAWLSGLTLGLLIVAFFLLAKVAAAAARLERNMEVLLRESGADPSSRTERAAEPFEGAGRSSPRMEEVEALVRDGRKIDAIKLYRELTGAGLAEAKAAVERMA